MTGALIQLFIYAYFLMVWVSVNVLVRASRAIVFVHLHAPPNGTLHTCAHVFLVRVFAHLFEFTCIACAMCARNVFLHCSC